ncbi:MAG: hypothetical protein ACLGG0_04865 [Bacteriovoracia bacterium]
MKKTWMLKFGGLLLIFAMISGCQEKIAPELSTPASTTTGGGTTTTTSTNRFYVTLTDTPAEGVPAEDLGYVLHKANFGSGISCQADDVVDTPETLDSTRDISCFVEAEEFALYYHGLEMQAQSDGSTCEYIAKAPFSYWNYNPGLSLRINGQPRQVVRFNCDDSVVEHLSGNDIPALYGNPSPTYTTVAQLCNRFFNLNDSGLTLPLSFGQLHLDVAPDLAGADIDEENLCTYNYGETMCDEGRIQIHDVTVTGTDTSDPPDNIPDVISVTGSTPRTRECGGSVYNCIGGAIRDVIPTANKGFTSVVTSLEENEGKVTMTINQSIEKRGTNLHAANFMRQCSGVANYNAANSFTPLPGVEFDPNVLASYSKLGVSTTGTQEKDTNNLDVIPLADHPFRAGIPGNVVATFAPNSPLRKFSAANMSNQPFYTFSCLDHAYDVKARIRVAVREWNRNFSPTTQNFQFVSDVYNRALPYATRTKMDAGSAVTLLEYPTIYDDDSSNDIIDLGFNNFEDWDDRLTFSNSATGTCGSAINVDGNWVLTLDPTAEIAPKKNYWFPGESTE